MEKTITITESYKHPITDKIDIINLTHEIPNTDEICYKVFDDGKTLFEMTADLVNREFTEYKNKLFYTEIYDYAKLNTKVLSFDNNPGICYYISSDIIKNLMSDIENPVIIGNPHIINLISKLWVFGKETNEESSDEYRDILLYRYIDEYGNEKSYRIKMIVYYGDENLSDKEILVFNKKNPKQSLILKFDLTDENYDFILIHSNR